MIINKIFKFSLLLLFVALPNFFYGQFNMIVKTFIFYSEIFDSTTYIQLEEINFSLTPDMMQLVNEQGERVLHAGKIKISIAGSLPSKRSLELGASKPVDAILNIE